jgi:hypothetical protein
LLRRGGTFTIDSLPNTSRYGNPSETLLKAKQERLENWRTLQELAGIIRITVAADVRRLILKWG